MGGKKATAITEWHKALAVMHHNSEMTATVRANSKKF